MKLFIFTWVNLLIINLMIAQIPAGYYDAANGKTGYELKTALKDIITNGHNDQGYDALYTLYQSSDVDNYYENDQTLLDIYSEIPSGADSYEYAQTGDKCGNYQGEGDCYNREHLVPQSVFNSAAPMKNDGHFVVPSDGYVNSKRSNYAFGIVNNPDWTSTNGSKVGPNTTAGYTGTVFEPIDEFKGDIARMLFYFATRYEDQVASWSHPMLNGTSDQVFSDWFLDILLQWNTDDPVSQREIDRNEAVYNFQGNRNPYIDHPEWVNEVWNSQNNNSGSTCIDEDFVDFSDWTNNGTSEDTSSSHYGNASPCRAFGTNDYLISPSVDNPNTLQFHQDASNGGDGNAVSLEYKIGTGSWVQFYTFNVDKNGADESVDLTNLSGVDLSAETDVTFKFNSTFNTWYLDDVVVQCGVPAGSGPTITNITQSPTTVTSSDTVSVSADVTDPDGIGGVELHWGTTSGSLTHTINMSLSSGDTFTTDSGIPAQADGTTVYYEIYALDNNADDTTSTEQSYTVNDNPPCASELIISEYIEGSSNNKYLEFYNGTGNTVNMNNYEVRIYANGNSSPSSTISLNNTNLADGDVFVLAHSSADAWNGTPDQTSGSLGFNGDDAIELFNTATGQSVDIFGQIGTDPGSAWGSGSTSTAEHTLVRKSAITTGDTNGTDAFDPSVEWDGYAQDDVTHLGSHTMTCGACIEPDNDAVFHTNSPQNVTTTSLTLNWTNGNGENRIVVLREANPVSFIPVDGTTYTANADFNAGTDVGTNEKVVYNGNGSTVDVTGLTPGTLYYAIIYEYNCAPGSEDYFTSGTPATDSFYTTPEKPDSFTAGCIGAISIDLSWTAPATGNFDGYLLVVREGATPHSVNSLDPNTNLGDNTDYSAAATYGGTSPQSHILYKGTNTSVTITGLTNNTSYTFEVFTYSANGSLYRYSTGKTTTKTIVLQNVSDAHASPGNTKAIVYWINPVGCYDEILVVANETAGIDFTPSGDGSTYTADTNYTTANQVVYKGTGNNVTVNNLTNGTTYYFEIFVRKGSEWSSGVEVSTTPVDATEFQPGQLVFVGYDGQYNGSGADDEYLIATLVDIEPGTTFSLVNSRYEAGAPANVRTDKWGGAGDDASDNPGVAEITYTGTNNIPAGSILRLHTLYNTTFLDYVGVITGTTETDQTADFAASVVYGTTSIPNISSNGSDQLFLVQGVFIFDGSADPQQANYTLKGTLLHGITNRAAWVPFTNTCNGDSSGGNSRESRLPSSLNCFNVEYSDASAISGFYQNDEVHTGSFREIILGISDATHWTLGTGRYNLDPTTTNDTDAGHTFTITGGHNPGTWVSTTDTNWFNCSNWETLAVPDATTDVSLDANSSVNAVIDANATYAELFNGQAVCRNLSISNLSVVAEGTGTLIVNGNLDISGTGVLDADDNDNTTPDADISIYGNMTTANPNSFLEGNSTVRFIGTNAQTVSCNNGNDTEEFYNLDIDNPSGLTFNSGNIYAGHDLNILQNTPIDIADGHYLLAGHNLVNNVDITIQNEGSLVQTDDTGTISGTGTFKLNKTSLPLNHFYDYVYWSSPINSSTFSLGDIVANAWGYYRFDPNEANNGHTYPGWVMLSATDIPQQGTGYAISAPNGTSANTILSTSFVKNHDPFNNGAITVPILKKGGPGLIGDYNLLGNPYPSAIDFNALANDNAAINGAYYLWTNCAGLSGNHHQDSGYTTYSVSGTSVQACSTGAQAGRYIATAQGFMVEANTDNANLIFHNTHRVLGNNNGFLNRPTQDRDILWLDMIDDTGHFTQAAVGFYDGATTGFDRLFDAKSMNAGNGYALYAVNGNDKLVIQALPYQDIVNTVVSLGIEISNPADVNLQLNHLEGFDDFDIYLKDNLLGTIHNLKTGSYTTHLDSGIYENRFELVFNRTLDIDEQSNISTLLLSQQNGIFKLWYPNNISIKQVNVYNTTGQLLFEKTHINSPEISINLQQIAKGNLLIFKVLDEKGQTTVKKAVKL